jgi:two-component system, LytTR family, sensor kinase
MIADLSDRVAPPMPGNLSPRKLAIALAATVPAIFMLRLTYFLFQDLADGQGGRIAERVFDESTGALLAVIPLGLIFWLALRMPLTRPLRRGSAPAYAACFALGTILHTTAMIVVRALLGPAIGLTGYDLSFRASRYAYEAANDVPFFVAVVALLALAENMLAEHARERRAANLEQNLLRAELTNLRLQLQPHFLFNALNTISSRMYEDVQAADALLGQLAELLRTSLRTTHSQEVALWDELAVLDQYLGLMRARFGDRLDVRVDAAGDALDVLVPSMVLQPLVENAVRHGGVSRTGNGRITVTAIRDGESLVLRVHDDGEPSAKAVRSKEASGTGLSTTAKRLRLLYGGSQSMSVGPASDGGFEVVLRIPARKSVSGPRTASPDLAQRATIDSGRTLAAR